MAQALHKLFSFSISTFPESTFWVKRFSGKDELSSLFRFEIILIAEKDDLKPEDALQGDAQFILHTKNGDCVYKGVLSRFENSGAVGKHTVYHAVLAPKAWLMSLNKTNRIFLDKQLPQLLSDTFEHSSLASGADFQMKLSGEYPSRRYVCQYNESDYNFALRWMESLGAYFYFDEQSGAMTVTDTKVAHVPSAYAPDGGELVYSPPSGLGDQDREKTVFRLAMRQTPVPQSVMVQDWNYRTPDLTLKDETPVDNQGRGTFRYYGDHFQTNSQGKNLSKIRAQELQCRAVQCHGESGAPSMRSGYTFKLKNHFHSDCNKEYLLTGVEHHGAQEAYLASEIGLEGGRQEQFSYRNTFNAIQADLQYRPERSTPKPRFYGVMNAHVDAAGSGKYAEVDAHGRYKVILPFDLSGRKDGRASAWLRMAQPYTGNDHGMHFPLHKGVEVLLMFIDGDPDRPIIASAAPNPEFPSQIKDSNQSKSVITTSGQNKLHIEDQEGGERVLLHSPQETSFVRLGQPNDPASVYWDHDEDNAVGLTISTNKSIQVKCGMWNKIIFGNSSASFLGWDHKTVMGVNSAIILGFELGLLLGPGNLLSSFQPIKTKLLMTDEEVNEEKAKISAQENSLYGQKTVIANEVAETAESNEELADEIVELAEDVNELAQEKQTLAQEKIDLAETKTRMSQEKTILSEQTTRLNQEMTALAQEKTKLLEEVQELLEEKMRTAEAVTEMTEECAKVVANEVWTGVSSTNLHGDHNEL